MRLRSFKKAERWLLRNLSTCLIPSRCEKLLGEKSPKKSIVNNFGSGNLPD
jgi:hypothetical protein